MTRLAIVTGSNKGIGKEIVRQLAGKLDKTWTIYLTARNEALGKKALEEIQKEGFSGKVEFHQLDISEQSSIDNFRDYIKTKYEFIDILVNNAAIAFKNDATEPFSFQAEETIRINVFGTNNCCKALFPLLKPHARVVNVSSSAGRLSMIRGQEPEALELRRKLANEQLTEDQFIDLMKDFVQSSKDGQNFERGWGRSAYAASKVGVSALTRIQQREMTKNRPNDDIAINHVHPGYVVTDMTSHKGDLQVEDGAKSPVYLALLPNDTKYKGSYFWCDCTEADWINNSI